MNASAASRAAQSTALRSMMNDPAVRAVRADVISKIQNLGIQYPNDFTTETYKADVETEFFHRVRADKGLTEIYRTHLAA